MGNLIFMKNLRLNHTFIKKLKLRLISMMLGPVPQNPHILRHLFLCPDMKVTITIHPRIMVLNHLTELSWINPSCSMLLEMIMSSWRLLMLLERGLAHTAMSTLRAITSLSSTPLERMVLSSSTPGMFCHRHLWSRDAQYNITNTLLYI